MDRHVQVVAGAFYVASAVLGLPSVTALLYTGFQLIRIKMLEPAASSNATAATQDGMIELIQGVGRIVGGAFRMIGAAGQWLLFAIAIVSLAIVLVAAMLFFTARGLHLAQFWAKWSASFWMLGLLLAVVSSGAMVRRGVYPLFLLAGLGATVYGFWALWRKPV